MGKTSHEMCQISGDKNRGDDKSSVVKKHLNNHHGSEGAAATSSQGWQFIWREFSTFQPNPIWVNYYAQLLFQKHFFSEVSNPKMTDFLFDHQ